MHRVTQFFCFTLVQCSRVAHYHGRGTEAALSALPPGRGSELGGVSRPSRPCCLPEGSVEALATRSAHEPNELENRLGWGARSALGAPGLGTVQTDSPATEYVAPAPSSSRTYDYVAPAPVIGHIAPASAAPCGSPLRFSLFFSQVYQEQIVAGEATQNI